MSAYVHHYDEATLTRLEGPHKRSCRARAGLPCLCGLLRVERRP